MTETARTRAARIVVDEHDVLLRMLEEQRRAVRNAVHGLSEDQARSTPSASQLSLAAVIKHLTQGERTWTVVRMAGRDTETDPQGEWMAGFQVDSDETVPVLLARWAEVARATEEIVRAEPDLEREVAIPAETRRWLPTDVAFTVRWVLLHLVEEAARHAGHADIIRESIDGKGAWQLEAEAQGIAGPGWN
jgi:uncharacterized damage-inducible protein DinB